MILKLSSHHRLSELKLKSFCLISQTLIILSALLKLEPSTLLLVEIFYLDFIFTEHLYYLMAAYLDISFASAPPPPTLCDKEASRNWSMSPFNTP